METIVIGAGPAGLAVAACLRRANLPCQILEQRDQLGASWRQHYDRLRLHTAKAYSALPFLPFPKAAPRYPTRAQVVQYLEHYARQFQLSPRYGQRMRAARYIAGRWQIETQDTHYAADNLVIAAGNAREPNLPTWPDQGLFGGPILHSVHYRNGAPFKNQRVLVVGFGNSGGEIALDLWEHGAQPSLAVRGPVNVIPRELLGIPILAISIVQRRLPPQLADALNGPILRLAIGDLTRYGLRPLPYGALGQIARDGRVPLIDVGTVALIKRGQIGVFPGISQFTASGVGFTDGRQQAFDAVILATGYRPRVDTILPNIPGIYDERGTPFSSGRATGLPGLYFCGYHVSPTGMLREIALEAQQISAAIGRRVAPG